MEYPKDFSKQAIARIEKVEIRAGLDLEKNRTVFGPPLPVHLRTYIMAVVLAFGHEVCAFGRPSIPGLIHIGPELWGVVRIKSETRAYLEAFIRNAYMDKAGKSILNSSGYIDQGVLSDFLHTPEWLAFQTELETIADLQSKPAPQPLQNPYRNLSPIIPPKSTTAQEIARLRAEARITLEELAAETDFNQSTVYRHESGESTPQPWRVSKYEKVFSKLLERKIVIPVTPIKRK